MPLLSMRILEMVSVLWRWRSPREKPGPWEFSNSRVSSDRRCAFCLKPQYMAKPFRVPGSREIP